MHRLFETRYGPAGPRYWRHIVASFGLSHVETEVPATHVGHELIGGGMLILAGGGNVSRWTTANSRAVDTGGI